MHWETKYLPQALQTKKKHKSTEAMDPISTRNLCGVYYISFMNPDMKFDKSSNVLYFKQFFEILKQKQMNDNYISNHNSKGNSFLSTC